MIKKVLCFSNRAYLSCRQRQLIIQTTDPSTGKPCEYSRPIEDIGVVVVASGLIPTLGIHHSNKYNAYCLADDIMEPYRPYVDLLVLDIIRNHQLSPEISTETKKLLLSIPSMDVKMGKLSRPLMIAASMTSASLAKCFLGETRKLQYPEIEI